jgi:TolA-binding protein
VKLGKEASRVRDFDVATHAFKQVAFSTHALAGAALVSLAQVVGDGQRDKAAAEKLYREALARFPGSDVATFAERKLAAAKA